MKQIYIYLKGAILSLFLLLTGSGLFAQPMSGAFTIDRLSASSSNNFTSFAAAASALGSRGVNGPVTLSVLNGPYTEQVTFNAITGASSTNKITIKGNLQTIQFTATSTTTAHTIRLNGTDHLVIDSLDVVCLSSSIGRGIWLNSLADSNVIRNCTIRMPNMTSTSNNNAYIAMTQGTSSMLTYGSPGSNNLIENNYMYSGVNRGPYSGVAIIHNNSTTVVLPNTVRNNEITNVYHSGIFAYYVWNQTWENNKIHNTGDSWTGTKYGIYLYNYQRGGDVKIRGNQIYNLTTASTTTYGMYLYNYNYSGAGSDDYIVENNKIERTTGSLTYGIYLYQYSYLASASTTPLRRVANNEIILLNGTSTQYGIYDYNYYSTARMTEYVGNKIVIRPSSSVSVYGLYCMNGYTYNYDVLAANNIVDIQNNGFVYGIYFYNVYQNKANCVYNTVYSSPQGTGTTSSTKYLYMVYYSTGDFKNNIATSLDNGGTVYAVYHYGGAGVGGPSTFDHNNMDIQRTSHNISFYNYNGSTTAQFIGYDEYMKQMGGKNCISVNPNYTNIAGMDYTPQSFSMVNKGTPLTYVSDDINKKSRSNTPDIGAIEFDLDVAIQPINLMGADGTGGSYECGGYSENVSVTVLNKNTKTINNIPVMYKLNGTVIERGLITASIAPNATATYDFKIPAVFNKPGMNTLTVGLDGSDDGLSDNEASDNVNIVRSPAGFTFSEGARFPGYFRDVLSGGTLINPDVTAPDSVMQYVVENPSDYANADYGTIWTGTVFARTMGGQSVSVSMAQTPNASNKGVIQFTASKSLEDSMVYVGYTVLNTSTQCDSTIGRWIYVIPAPDADFTANDVCDGTPVEYKSTSAISKQDVVLIYEWNFNDPNSTADRSEIAEGVYNYTTFGQYTIDMVVRHSVYPKFTFSKSKMVTVTPVPVVDYKVLSACAGNDVVFTNNTTTPIPATLTYAWSFGDGNTSSSREPRHRYAQPGQYQVSLTATANGCSNTVTKNANQFAVPDADFTWEGECVSQPIMLKGANTIAIGRAGYEWVFEGSERRTGTEESYVWNTPGTKTVKLRAISEFNCMDSVSKQITIVDAPVANFEFSDPCNLSDINFTFTGTTVGVPLYVWDFNGESTSNVSNPSVRFDEGEKTVKLRVETSQNSCVSEISKTFRVMLQPKADFDVSDVCEGEEAVFTNLSEVARGNMNFNWKLGDGAQNMSTNPRHSYNVGGATRTFNVTLVASVTGGCSDSISKTITVNELPNVNFTVDRRGRTIGLTPTGNTANYTFKRWTFGDGGSSTEDAPVYTYDNVIKGQYTVCFSATSTAGCLNNKCENISIDLLGIEDTEASWLKVYPNPSNGVVNVQIDGAQKELSIRVLNQTGAVVYENVPSQLNNNYGIDLSAHAAGVYLIQVINDGFVANKKITVVK